MNAVVPQVGDRADARLRRARRPVVVPERVWRRRGARDAEAQGRVRHLEGARTPVPGRSRRDIRCAVILPTNDDSRIRNRMTTLMPGREPLTDEELERLGAFLRGLRNPDRLTLEGLDGFFCALIAGPDLVLPSEYLPVVWGGEMADEDAFESDEQANELLGLLMRHWNAIVNEYETERMYVPAV